MTFILVRFNLEVQQGLSQLGRRGKRLASLGIFYGSAQVEFDGAVPVPLQLAFTQVERAYDFSPSFEMEGYSFEKSRIGPGHVYGGIFRSRVGRRDSGL